MTLLSSTTHRSALLLVLIVLCSTRQTTQAQPGVSLYTIPVVFHVLHQNGSENISEPQIANAVDLLNMYYDAPTWEIDPPFDTVVADMDIAFVLATTAPDGSPTSGIDRIETPLSLSAGGPESYLHPWPRNRYLNIWTVTSLDSVGVAYLTARPEQVDGMPCTDGILIYHSYVGTIGTGSFVARRTLSQAVGRFLDLKMLFEDPLEGGPCGDDDVADTPPCPLISWCNSENAACSTLPANIQNIMTFSYCQEMFTRGQRERVHACLNNSLAQRNELASGTSTGTSDCSTSISDHNSAARITVYPSPFTDRIFLRGLTRTRYSVQLTDLSGRTVASSNNMLSGQPLHISAALAPGSYILVVNDGSMTTALNVVKE